MLLEHFLSIWGWLDPTFYPRLKSKWRNSVATSIHSTNMYWTLAMSLVLLQMQEVQPWKRQRYIPALGELTYSWGRWHDYTGRTKPSHCWKSLRNHVKKTHILLHKQTFKVISKGAGLGCSFRFPHFFSWWVEETPGLWASSLKESGWTGRSMGEKERGRSFFLRKPLLVSGVSNWRQEENKIWIQKEKV